MNMEICIVNGFSYMFNGGVEKQILELIKRLIKKKVKVKFVSPMTIDDLNGDLLDTEIIYVPSKKITIPSFYPPVPIFIPVSLNKIYEKGISKIKLIHSFTEYFTSMLLRKKLNDQILIHSQQTVINSNNIDMGKKIILNFLQKNAFSKFYNKCDKIIPISHFIESQLIKYHSIQEERLKVIPNGVDCNKFKFSRKLRNEFREENDIGEIFIFMAGRIVKEKGYHNLLYAISKNQYKNKITVGIAGKGYFLKSLKELSKKLNINTIFLGQLEDPELIKAYSGSDIFVTPSTWQEPFGIVNIEAMSCSRPVIASNVGGIPDIIENFKSGFLYKPLDISNLSKSITTLIEDEKLRKKIGRTARNKVEKTYNWDILTDEWINTYKSHLN